MNDQVRKEFERWYECEAHKTRAHTEYPDDKQKAILWSVYLFAHNGHQRVRDAAIEQHLRTLLEMAQPFVESQAQAERMLDGFGKKQRRPVDELLERINSAIAPTLPLTSDPASMFGRVIQDTIAAKGE